MNGPVRFLRLPQVIERRACSRPTIYRDVQRGVFPAPVRRGRRCSVWIESEVDAVLTAETTGATDAALRALVSKLIAERGGSGSADIPAAKRAADGKFSRSADAR